MGFKARGKGDRGGEEEQGDGGENLPCVPKHRSSAPSGPLPKSNKRVIFRKQFVELIFICKGDLVSLIANALKIELKIQ